MASVRESDAGTRLDEWSPRLLKSRLYQRILVDIIIGALAPGEQLDENALAIPYGNLAFMHEAMGHNEAAQNFARLAGKYDAGDNGKH